MVKILKIFLESLDDGSSLMNTVKNGYSLIFEDLSCSVGSGLMLQNNKTNMSDETSGESNTTNYDNSEGYIGSAEETFGEKPDDIVEKLNIFDISQVTVHGNEDANKFNSTPVYTNIINDLSDNISHHALDINHIGDKHAGVYILPVNKSGNMSKTGGKSTST